MPETIYISGGDLVLPDEVAPKTSLSIERDRIGEVGGGRPRRAEAVSAEDCYVLPGLIDLHYHGRLISLSPAELPALFAEDMRELAAAGVTRFLPTLASAPLPDWLSALPVLERLVEEAVQGASTQAVGAVPLGIHLEGIFLNPAAAGAHPPGLLIPFDLENSEHLAVFEAGRKILRMMTFAPEVSGNDRLIEFCRSRKILPSLGHSTASPEAVAGFVERGLRHMTHLFNGMKGLHHREPGPPLAGLLDRRISVDLIADGYHIDPGVLCLIHRLKRREKRLLISDNVRINLPGAVSGKGDEPNRLPGGGLAGSRLNLLRAVRNYQRFTGCSLPEAVAMASLNPARLLGRERELGSLAPGKIADLVIVNRDLEPRLVFVNGRRLK